MNVSSSLFFYKIELKIYKNLYKNTIPQIRGEWKQSGGKSPEYLSSL